MPHLKPLLNSPELIKLNTEILPNVGYYPESENIFNVFSMAPEDIKVVILGQDPYPQPNQAIGYAFAVPTAIPLPFSLRSIWWEVNANIPGGIINFTEYMQSSEAHELWHWREQGVFLLNTSLTVKAGKPGSHQQYWQNFISGVIATIGKYSKYEPVWMLWGAHAKSYRKRIQATENFLPTRILEAGHPAAEAYNPGKGGFYGCEHFRKANEIFHEHGEKTILWT